MRFLIFLPIFLTTYLNARNFEGMAISRSTFERLQKGERVNFELAGINYKELRKAVFWYQELPTIGLPTLYKLAPKRGKGVKIAVIDSASNHGQHIVGIIRCLAPQAEVTLIKAFEGNSSTKKVFSQALELAQKHSPDILNLSLKLAEDPLPGERCAKKLKQQLSKFPYVVTAAGNAGKGEPVNQLSYPARFGGVIDVGAFGYDDKGNFPIAAHSQYERRVGPKFVMPGYNILSNGLVPGQKEQMYVFMGGTSSAAAVMTGLLALILAEFKNVFSKEEILKVMAASGVRLGSDAEWGKRSLFGTLDVRGALKRLGQVRRASPVDA